MSCQILKLATRKIKGCLSELKCHLHKHFPEISNRDGYLWKPLVEMTILAPNWQLSNCLSDPVMGIQSWIHNSHMLLWMLTFSYNIFGESCSGSQRQPVTETVCKVTQGISEEKSQPLFWKSQTKSQNTRYFKFRIITGNLYHQENEVSYKLVEIYNILKMLTFTGKWEVHETKGEKNKSYLKDFDISLQLK